MSNVDMLLLSLLTLAICCCALEVVVVIQQRQLSHLNPRRLAIKTPNEKIPIGGNNNLSQVASNVLLKGSVSRKPNNIISAAEENPEGYELACYSARKCGARDPLGNPIQVAECESCADGFISTCEKATNDIRKLKDAEIKRLKEDQAIELQMQVGGLSKKCQQKIEGVFREIDKHKMTGTHYPSDKGCNGVMQTEHPWYKALKARYQKREGVE